jgi:hypothetical protein
LLARDNEEVALADEIEVETRAGPESRAGSIAPEEATADTAREGKTREAWGVASEVARFDRDCG